MIPPPSYRDSHHHHHDKSSSIEVVASIEPIVASINKRTVDRWTGQLASACSGIVDLMTVTQDTPSAVMTCTIHVVKIDMFIHTSSDDDDDSACFDDDHGLIIIMIIMGYLKRVVAYHHSMLCGKISSKHLD